MAKIWIYTIAQNEESNVAGFLASCKDADGVLVLDTGSTDGTRKRLLDGGALAPQIATSGWNSLDEYDSLLASDTPPHPFRFDLARNESLERLRTETSADIGVCIDLDERLAQGWREIVENAFDLPHVHSLMYRYGHDMDGETCKKWWWYTKIHRPATHRWVSPVHEYVEASRDGATARTDALLVKHYPDRSRSRRIYLSLARLGARERPDNPRAQMYLARELMCRGGLPAEISSVLEGMLSMPQFVEALPRSWVCSKLADIARRRGDPEKSLQWHMRAVIECGHQREPWVYMANEYRLRGDHHGVISSIRNALAIDAKQYAGVIYNDPACWGYMPHELLSIASYYLGDYKTSLDHAELALSLEPSSTRLQRNLTLIRERMGR